MNSLKQKSSKKTEYKFDGSRYCFPVARGLFLGYGFEAAKRLFGLFFCINKAEAFELRKVQTDAHRLFASCLPSEVEKNWGRDEERGRVKKDKQRCYMISRKALV